MNQATARPVRWLWIVGGLAAAVVVAVGVCETLGWPFLAAPMQRWIGSTLERRVAFSEDPASQPTAVIHLIGGIEVSAAYIEIGAPVWSQEPYMLRARDASITLGYLDLWRASQGKPLHIRELRARQLDSSIERLADGRASWQFGKKTNTPDSSATAMPSFGRLQVDKGTSRYRDAKLAANLDADFSLTDGSATAREAAALPASAASGAALPEAAASAGFQLAAKGTYLKNPVTVTLNTSGVLPVLAKDASAVTVPVALDARIGRATVTFRGTATDALNLTALKGRFSVQGPSLAAVGDPVGVTLPTTGAFRTEGLIAKDGVVWNAVIERATIGQSRLGGAFQYDPRPGVPVLSGRLTGSKLLLADLGPVVGTSAQTGSSASAPKAVPAAPSVKAKPAGRAAAKTTNTPPAKSNDKPGRVLPDREFDLPSLRAMNANVLIVIDSLDLGSSFLEPLKPLKTHLVLRDGVLTFADLDARTGQGRLFGNLQLDGRGKLALWTANIGWSGIRLESWIRQVRSDDAPPYITGRLGGQARVAGEGKSTAAILGSLQGGVRFRLANGSISHLAVEAAGLDLAQGLGLLIKGDDTLPLNCTVADFKANRGVLTPRAFVIDTRDSLLVVDGTVSLANEGMDLKVTTTPKDFSPFALRTPVRVRGSFSNPSITIDPSRLGPRVGAAAVLSLINPLAALLPFIDFGDSAEATKGADTCRALSQRIAARPALPAPPNAAPVKR